MLDICHCNRVLWWSETKKFGMLLQYLYWYSFAFPVVCCHVFCCSQAFSRRRYFLFVQLLFFYLDPSIPDRKLGASSVGFGVIVLYSVCKCVCVLLWSSVHVDLQFVNLFLLCPSPLTWDTASIKLSSMFVNVGSLQEVLQINDVLARVYLARLCYILCSAPALDGKMPSGITWWLVGD